MLSELFGVSRAKILPVLVFAKQPVHLREVARRANMAPIQAARTLDGLASVGLVETSASAGRRLFRLRRETVAGGLLCKLVEESRGLLVALGETLKKEKAIKKAFVYGSFASGKEGLKSDVDLIIVGSPDWASLSRRVSALEAEFGREINYGVYAPEEFEEKSKRPFLSRVLDAEKIFLVGSNDSV